MSGGIEVKYILYEGIVRSWHDSRINVSVDNMKLGEPNDNIAAQKLYSEVNSAARKCSRQIISNSGYLKYAFKNFNCDICGHGNNGACDLDGLRRGLEEAHKKRYF